MYISNAIQSKKYDQILLDNGYSIIELVDLASDCLLEECQSFNNYVIVCGTGNNGADGLSLALKLHQLHKHVEVVIFKETDLSAANAYYLNKVKESSISYSLFNELSFNQSLSNTECVIDGMFGFGLHSCPKEDYALCIDLINQTSLDVISIDIPTGLNCDTGISYHHCIIANKTITLTAYKNGFLNPESTKYTGKVILKTLATPSFFKEANMYYYFEYDDAKKLLKDRKYDGHKKTYGHIGMITGCDQYKGAALLSTKSAVYSGAGLVTVISDPSVNNLLPTICLEATTCVRPPILQSKDIENYDALLIGSGLGLEEDKERYVIDCLYQSNISMVLDGDALTILSKHLNLLKDKSCILTPHMGEFKRLCHFNESDDLLEVASTFAKDHQIVLVLKGPHTIITDGNTNYKIATGNKAMAVAGMGDTLAGIITSFVGQKYDLLEAAVLGAYIHSYCGDVLEKDNYTVIPTKLIDLIPSVMKDLNK